MTTLYRKRAGHYDYTANLYYLIGFREWKYRKMAVAALDLHPGDTVVEIGCGTGLNFPLLQAAVGPNGRIIGVDLTDAMLAQARKRVDHYGWANVELVQSDAAAFQFPVGTHGILSTFALTLVPEYDRVIQNGAKALAPGKRWVVLDLKVPSYLPARLGSLLVSMIRPFIVSDEYLTRRPWESVRKYLANVVLTELYFGFAYIAIGERRREGTER
jgi:ubiquinone/menaquinone biosynthesis C-methylase UbiE